jgi:ABC-2 type transport system ATP-binding protein
MTHIVEVKDLTKRYGKKTTVHGVTFAVEKGEVFGILGPNGAGKTTTLEMIETLRPIDDGSALLDGIDVSKKPKEVRKIIGVQTQSSAFYDKVNLREQLELFASIYGVKTDIDELLAEAVKSNDLASRVPS